MTLAVDTALLREPNLWVPGKQPVGPVTLKQPFSGQWNHYFICDKREPIDLAEKAEPILFLDTSREGVDRTWEQKATAVGRSMFSRWANFSAPCFIENYPSEPIPTDGKYIVYILQLTRYEMGNSCFIRTPFPEGALEVYFTRTTMNMRNTFANTVTLELQSLNSDYLPRTYVWAYEAISGKTMMAANGLSGIGTLPAGLVPSSSLNYASGWSGGLPGHAHLIAGASGHFTLDQIAAISKDPYQFLEPA